MKEKKKFRDTKFGKFLNEKLLPALPDLAISAATMNPLEIIGTVGDMFKDKTYPDNPELELARIEFESNKMEFESEALAVVMQDKASAREAFTKVNESEHSSWLSKNTHSILAIGVVIACFIVFYIVVFTTITDAQRSIVMFILGALAGYVSQVLNFYFGSSSGSSEKNKSLDKVLGKYAATGK